jgi:hypothetical protein
MAYIRQTLADTFAQEKAVLVETQLRAGRRMFWYIHHTWF